MGHTVSNIIVMAFLPRNVVGCLLKKRLTKWGHGRPRTHPPPLSLRPWYYFYSLVEVFRAPVDSRDALTPISLS